MYTYLPINNDLPIFTNHLLGVFSAISQITNKIEDPTHGSQAVHHIYRLDIPLYMMVS